MVNLHLSGEILLQPFVLNNVVIDKRYCLEPCNLHCRLAFLLVVKPSLSPPVYAELVRVDADFSGDVESLNIYVKVGEGVDNLTTRRTDYIIPPSMFFFSASPHVDRKTL